MQLDRALVPLRPRSMWEAADVGFVLARQHLRILTVLYLVPAVLVAIILWLSPLSLNQASLALWWFKPMFEAPLTAWMGRAMFGELVSWRHLFTLWRQSVLKGLLGNLSLRRFHWGRGINLCIIQLEGAKGKARRDRQAILTQSQHHAGLLLCILFVFNVLLELSLISFLILMLPIDTESIKNWNEFIDYLIWFEERNNIAPLLVSAFIQSIIGPFFICSAFMLYINARTKLEAWDLEIAARRMQTAWNQQGRTLFDRKLMTWLLILPISFILSFQPKPVSAKQSNATATQSVQKATDTKQETNNIYKDIDTFGGNIETESYRWKHQLDQPQLIEESVDPTFENILKIFATSIRIIFFAFLISLTIWLIFKVTQGIRRQRSVFVQQENNTPLVREIPDEQLPDDIAHNAEQRLQQGDVRAALALLYQGTLHFYAEKRNLPISDADTENDFWLRLKPTLSSYDADFIYQLIQNWVRVAYGHHPISAHDAQIIIQTWRSHYGHA